MTQIVWVAHYFALMTKNSGAVEMWAASDGQNQDSSVQAGDTAWGLLRHVESPDSCRVTAAPDVPHKYPAAAVVN